MATKIAVILVNYHNWPDTLACLRSLGKNKDILKIVVDQKSPAPETAKYKKIYPEVKFIFLKENIGFAAANNLGIKIAQQKNIPYIFLLNNDALVAQDTLEKLYAFMEANENCGICAPVNYFATPKDKIAFSGGKIDLYTGTTPHFTDLPRQNRRSKFITGAAMFARTKIFKTVGLLDEKYFLYFEDSDFCQRINKTAWQMWIIAKAKIWHKVSTTASQHPFIYYYCQRNRLWFFKRYGNLFQFMPFFLSFIKDLSILALRGWCKPNKNNNRQNLAYSWLGVQDFLKSKFGKNYRLSD